MIDTQLIAPNTVITAKGDGNPVSLEAAVSRAFLVLLNITKIVEQESFELSVFGSPDAQTWDPKPLLTFPQKFYAGETPLLLELSDRPEARFVRAHWEVKRWGRGSEEPMFEVSVGLKEVPAEMLNGVGV